MTFQESINNNPGVHIDGQSFDKAVCQSMGISQMSIISNCIFKGDSFFTFDSGEISFIDCEFSDLNYVNFEFRKSGKVRFENCKINSDLKLLKTDVATILNCSISGSLDFSENRFKTVEILNTNSDSQIESIVFWDALVDQETSIRLINLHVGELRFRTLSPQKVHIIGGEYDKIVLNYGQGLKDLLIVGDEYKAIKIKIESLNMAFFNFEGISRIKDASIKNWNLSQFSLIEGSFKLQNVDFQNEIKIIGSDLKGVQLNDINLYDSKIFLDWTILNEAKFTNITWPVNHLVFSIIQTNENQRFGSLTEMYRQLKKISLNDSNNIQALHFYRNEMDSYWKRVKLDKSEKWWNRWLIAINKYSSNFGQSYWIPFIWIIVGHFLMCIVIWNFESDKWCGPNTFCTSNFSDGFANYLNWLIPFYKQPENWTSSSIIVGAIMRVYNGFFIYHFIKATRKFGKV
jgi:uncharacterized protein YjbI with pentapeptide repeats